MTESPTLKPLDLDTLELARGNHSPGTEMCVMEAVAFVAGEKWSDSPSCASPVLSSYLRSLNDALDGEQRQKLKPLIPMLVGTNTTPEDEQRRGLMAVDWMVRTYLPTWLELGKVTDIASALRAMPEITSWDQLVEITPTLIQARERSAAARDAARAAARAAAWAAARAAAWDAARAAAWDAARAAAWDAARDAAWDAARDAARAAAWDALKPTVSALQDSAIELAKRMVLK